MSYMIDVDKRDRDIQRFGVSYWYEDSGGQLHNLNPAGMHIYRANEQTLKDTIPLPVVQASHFRDWVATVFSPLWLLFTALIMVGAVVAGWYYPEYSRAWFPPLIGATITFVRALVAGWFELYAWAKEQ